MGACLRANFSTRSIRLMQRSSSLMVHSSYCWNRCETYLDSSLMGKVMVGCLVFHASRSASGLADFCPFLQGLVLQAFFKTLRSQRYPPTGGVQPTIFWEMPPPQTWSQTDQSPMSVNWSLWSLPCNSSSTYFSMLKFLSSIEKLASKLASFSYSVFFVIFDDQISNM